MDFIEHNHAAPLIALLDEIRLSNSDEWIIADIRRERLKPITNEAFLMVIKPSMLKADLIHVFFAGMDHIYVVWNGERKSVYQQLRGVVVSMLARTDAMHNIISYIDPQTDGARFRQKLSAGLQKSDKNSFFDEKGTSLQEHNDDPLGWNHDSDNLGYAHDERPVFAATREQIQHYGEIKNRKATSKKMEILIVEDSPFYQKLLSEIIRSGRSPGIDMPLIDMVESIKAGWNNYLKKAYDLIFVDLNLPDGSGHALTRAIKEINPTATVIIVTANNYEEEVDVAHQNNVDGFITKPYSKKQIMGYVEKCAQYYKGKDKLSVRG